MLPSMLPGSCEQLLDIQLRLQTKLQTCANLTELCLVRAGPSETHFNLDLLPCLPGLRSLVVKAQCCIVIHWRGTAAMPMLQSLECVSKDGLYLQLGSELHHRFTGRLSLATPGYLKVMQNAPRYWFGGPIIGDLPGLCNSLASFCALGNRGWGGDAVKHSETFRYCTESLAHANRLNGSREWAPKLGWLHAHGTECSEDLEVMITDAEGLEWVRTQYRAICHWTCSSLKGVRNVDFIWDSSDTLETD